MIGQTISHYRVVGVSAPAEVCPKARIAAMKALDSDQNLAEAHAALAYNRMSCDWDWSGAESEIRRAEELNPNDATIRIWHGGIIYPVGALEDAIAEQKRALELDPLSLVANTVLGQALYYAGRYDEAMEIERKTLEMDPGYLLAHQVLGWVYEKKGMFPAAIAELKQALSNSRGDPRFLSFLGHAYATAGQRGLAEQSVARLKDLSGKRYVSPYDIALVYAGLRQPEEIFKYLEMAFQDHSFWMVWLRIDPRFEPIRNDPRYHDILRRMHLER